MTKEQLSRSILTVGTVNKSIAMIASRCLRKKVSQRLEQSLVITGERLRQGPDVHLQLVHIGTVVEIIEFFSAHLRAASGPPSRFIVAFV